MNHILDVIGHDNANLQGVSRLIRTHQHHEIVYIPPSTSSAASPLRLTTSIDSFANDDNDLPQDLRRHFEAINQLDPDEQTLIKTLIEATLIRHQARTSVGRQRAAT